MKIEIAKPDRMSQSGSSLLRLIQNANMPVLDLLVRESIQNSLDAARDESDFIKVEFLTGNFLLRPLCYCLDQIGTKLLKKYQNQSKVGYEYLAIRDFYTQGLTGPLNYDQVKNDEYGNLLKLVYEISKPQEKEGAGGSWGLGKTIYFRVGIGLVFYYSRIRLNNGSFQSRLAVTLVEDEKNPNALLYNKEDNIRRGIAWWGNEISKGRTQPLTDEDQIERILTLFGIAPYRKEETGTTIIIPFIDSQKLLLDNFKETTDEDTQAYKPYWMDNLQDYLEIATQRWYAPRLNNPYYPYGKYLKVAINGHTIERSQMVPAFLLIQNLYNKANEKPVYNLEEEERIVVETISLRNEMSKAPSGKLAYIVADRQLLKMNPPDNYLAPNLYYGCTMTEKTENRPVIAFVRRPGMIVAYEESGKWVDKIPNTGTDQYLIALFILNSANTLKKRTDITVEEYVRKSETADHTSWSDYTLHGITPNIVSKTQKQIATKLTSVIKPKKEETSERKNTGYGTFLAEILLPPQDYGKESSPIPKRHSQKEIIRTAARKKGISLQFKPENTEYKAHSMTISADLVGTKEFHRCILELLVETDADNIKLWDWQNRLGTEIPFSLEEVEMVVYESKKKREILDILKVNYNTPFQKGEKFELRLEEIRNGAYWGLMLSKFESSPFYIQAHFKIHLNSRDFRPTIHFTKES